MRAKYKQYEQSNTKFIQEARAQRVEQAQVMGNLDDATREIIWLRCKLVELRQQTPEIDCATIAIATAITVTQNYQLRGIGPKKLFTGNDVRAYAPWEHSVKEKLCTNAVMYINNQERINYVFQ